MNSANMIIVKAMVESFSKQLMNDIKPIVKEFKDELNQLLSDSLLEYINKQTTKFNSIKTFLHRSPPRNFYDVYYKLNLQYFDKENKMIVVETEKIDDLFLNSNFITIIGDAGSGKSMLVKHLFLNSIMRGYNIPIVVDLRDLNKIEETIENTIKNIITNNNLSKNSKILERLLSNGDFVFFLDGYDELNKNSLDLFIHNIKEFTDKYEKNKFIITSRPHSNIEMLPLFSNFYMKPLENIEVDEFIKKQLLEEEMVVKIIKSIKENKNSYIMHFLKNPLLLSLYILTFQSYSEIPTKKYIFYRRVIEVLFSEHDSLSKLGYIREKRCNLSQEKIEEVLKRFSFLSYFEGVYNFERDYLLQKFKEVKERLADIEFVNNDLIYDLKSGISIWTEDGGIIAFTHRSLQEYFAALYLKNLSDSNKKIVYKKILDNILQQRVNEIDNFLCLCEEMDEINFKKYLLLPVMKTTKTLLDSNNNLTFTGFSVCNFYFSNISSSVDQIISNGDNLKYQFATTKEFNYLVREIFSTFQNYRKTIGENCIRENLSVIDFFQKFRNTPEMGKLIICCEKIYKDIDERILSIEEFLACYEKSEADLINLI